MTVPVSPEVLEEFPRLAAASGASVGKAMGGGIAISAVAGRGEIMALIEDRIVSHLGTQNGNCVATAAAIATITKLSEDGGAAYAHMDQTAGKLANGIRNLLDKHCIPGIVNHIGPVFHLMFTEEKKVEDFAAFNKRDGALYTRFAEKLLEEGVLVRTSGLWYVSAVHGEDEVAATLQAVDRVMANL